MADFCQKHVKFNTYNVILLYIRNFKSLTKQVHHMHTVHSVFNVRLQV